MEYPADSRALMQSKGSWKRQAGGRDLLVGALLHVLEPDPRLDLLLHLGGRAADRARHPPETVATVSERGDAHWQATGRPSHAPGLAAGWRRCRAQPLRRIPQRDDQATRRSGHGTARPAHGLRTGGPAGRWRGDVRVRQVAGEFVPNSFRGRAGHRISLRGSVDHGALKTMAWSRPQHAQCMALPRQAQGSAGGRGNGSP